MTHFVSTQDLHEISFADDFWHWKYILNVLEPNASHLRNRKQKCSPDFLLFSLFADSVTPALKQDFVVLKRCSIGMDLIISSFVIITCHYTLQGPYFLFQDPRDVFEIVSHNLFKDRFIENHFIGDIDHSATAQVKTFPAKTLYKRSAETFLFLSDVHSWL